MLRLMRDKKGQSLVEYAIVISLVVAAAIAMQTYVKRALQGKVQGATDLLSTTQYEPYYLDSSFVSSIEDTKTKTGTAKAPTIGIISDMERSGTQTLSAPE